MLTWPPAGYQTLADLARSLGVSRQYAHRLIRAHGIVSHRVPAALVITEADARRLLDSRAPRPDLRSEDGRAAYSAEALEQLLAWQQAQLPRPKGRPRTSSQQTE